MKNLEKILLIISLIVLGIMIFLYVKTRKENENLIAEINDLKNQINQRGIASVTNMTLPYIPEEMPVAEPNNEIENNASELTFNRNPENVTIEVDKDTITPESVSIIIKNNDDGMLSFGEEFRVEEKVNGEWKSLNYLPDELLIWNAIAYTVKGKDQTTQKINIKGYYGELSDGIYRIVKPVFAGKNAILYSDEFEIK